MPLGARIPRSLYRKVKVHCVENGSSVMAFVVAALEEKLVALGPWDTEVDPAGS